MMQAHSLPRCLCGIPLKIRCARLTDKMHRGLAGTVILLVGTVDLLLLAIRLLLWAIVQLWLAIISLL